MASTKSVKQLAEQRRQRIRSRESVLKERAASLQGGQQRNILPQDVIRLKEIFDIYDANGDGVLQSPELRKALEEQKSRQQRAARDSLHKGTKCTLEERQRAAGVVKGVMLDQKANAEGVFLVDMSSQLFAAMDLDGDGGVDFKELLRICYPTAAKYERDEILSWLSTHKGSVPQPPPHASSPAPPEAQRLSAKAAAEIAALFGAILVLFAEYDSNGDELIDLAEFTAMFASTGAFGGGEPTGLES